MADIKIGRMVIGAVGTNCYFLYREGNKECVVIDAPDRGRDIADTLKKNGFTVAALLLTHGHFDHIWGAGHTKGSCCYYVEEAGLLLAGDTLFAESVGRSDLPTGSGAVLCRSINEKLFVLPEDTKVYPGHGDETTIGHEKKYNPFVMDF